MCSSDLSTNLLVSVLQTAASFKNASLNERIGRFTTHTNALIRQEATRLLASQSMAPLEQLIAQLKQGDLPAQRAALRQLSSRPSPATTEALKPWVDRLVQGTLPQELRLDVFLSASSQANSELSKQLTTFTNSIPSSDPLGLRRLALQGGDAAQGRRWFAERADLGCQRCHKLHGEGGDVGPELQGLGRSKGREYVLRSILEQIGRAHV